MSTPQVYLANIPSQFHEIANNSKHLRNDLHGLTMQGGAKDIATSVAVVRSYKEIALLADKAVDSLASNVKLALGLKHVTYKCGDVIPEEILNFCARLYNDYQYVGNDGKVNAFDRRYHGGGVHFNRLPEWFAEQMRTDGAHLIIGSIASGEPVSYCLFFTKPSVFPSFASDTLRYRQVDGIGEALAYTYLFIVDKQFTGLGLGKDIIDLTRAACAKDGCRVLAHEYFRSPTPSTASTIVHEGIFAREYRSIFVPAPATHDLKIPTEGVQTRVYYAHSLIPTDERTSLNLNAHGLQIIHDGHEYERASFKSLGIEISPLDPLEKKETSST